MRALAILFASTLLACGSEAAPAEVTPEPAPPPPTHIPPPEQEAASLAQPPSTTEREPAAPGHLRVVRHEADHHSWDEVEHPDPELRAHLTALSQEVAEVWDRLHLGSARCAVSVAHPSVVSFHCRAAHRARRVSSVDAELHVAIGDGRLFAFAPRDVLAERQNIGGLTRAACRRLLAANRRDDPSRGSRCEPEDATVVVAADGLHVHYRQTGSAESLVVLVPFTDAAKFRTDGPLAGLLGEGTPTPLEVASGPWAVSDAGAARVVIPQVARVPAALREGLRLDGVPGGVVRYVLPEETSAQDAATMAQHFGAQAHRVSAQGELRPVVRRVARRPFALMEVGERESRQLPQGTVAWVFDPEAGNLLPNMFVSAWAFTPVVAGTIGNAGFVPLEGCAPSSAESDELVALTDAMVRGQRRDVLLTARVDGDELEVAVHLAGPRCARGRAIQTVRVPGTYEDVRLGSTEPEGGIGLLVVGHRAPDGERAEYGVYRLGSDAPLLTAERPHGVSAEGFLRVGETIDGDYFPITVSHHPDYTGDAEPEDYPVRRFSWDDGRLVEAEPT